MSKPTMLAFLLISSILFTGTLGHPFCSGEADKTIYYAPDSLCFTLGDSASAFAAAKTSCQAHDSNDGRVAEINSEEKATLIKDAVDQSTLTFPIWAGIVAVANGWEYDSGPMLSSDYAPWSLGSAPPAATGVCAKMNDQKKWENEMCTAPTSFVCQYSATVWQCEGNGWFLNPAYDACVKVVKRHRKPYSKAQGYCQKLGGNLATKMTTRKQRRQAMSLAKFQGHFWMGIEDLVKDAATSTFTDFEGNALDETPFKHPGPFPGRYCATLKKRRWYAKDCTKRFHFICQKPPVDPNAGT